MGKITKRQAALETVSLLLDDLIENPPPSAIERDGRVYWAGDEGHVDDVMWDFQQGDGGDLIRSTHPEYLSTPKRSDVRKKVSQMYKTSKGRGGG